MRGIIFLLIFSANFLYAQVDTVYRSGESADTMIIKKAPVTVSQQLVIDEYLYKEVQHFFYIKPYISYINFQNTYNNPEGSLLAQAFCYSVREKSSFNTGVDFGYKYQKFNFLVGYAYYVFREKVLDYKNNTTHNNHYVQNHINAKLSFDIDIKKITIAPFAGVSYNMAVNAKTVYPVLRDEVIAFEETNDFQKAGALYFTGGLEFKFFNTSRVSPFLNAGYMKNLIQEKKSSKYAFSYTKDIFSGSAGLMFKF